MRLLFVSMQQLTTIFGKQKNIFFVFDHSNGLQPEVHSFVSFKIMWYDRNSNLIYGEMK